MSKIILVKKKKLVKIYFYAYWHHVYIAYIFVCEIMALTVKQNFHHINIYYHWQHKLEIVNDLKR
jgi:hypothetical protein